MRRTPVLVLATLLMAVPCPSHAQLLFRDEFEGDLDAWTFPHGRGADLIDSGDPAHGQVLSLRTHTLPVLALIRGSQDWGDVRVEGDVLFPEDVNNYLGFIYRYTEGGGRLDFGNLYIKGNGSYIRANPHRDTNVGRTLYEEFRTSLEGPGRIVIGRWSHFALEVVGGRAHLYVGAVDEPQVTFPFFEATRGAFGFEPRNPGGAVWIDNVRVRSIGGFTYRGSPRPDVPYRPGDLVTDWQVLGPVTRMLPEVETRPFDPGLTVPDRGRPVAWRDYPADPRGAVLTSRVTDYRGPARVAYFHTSLSSPSGGPADIEVSSVDDMAIWLNGEFEGFLTRQDLAWWDVGANPDHAGRAWRVRLQPGANHLVIRVVGGTYATGGFFMKVTVPESDSARRVLLSGHRTPPALRRRPGHIPAAARVLPVVAAHSGASEHRGSS